MTLALVLFSMGRRGRICVLSAAFVSVLANVGCGAKSDPSPAPEQLHPPASISVTVCAKPGNTDPASCGSCCVSAGFFDSSFVYQGQCVCGPFATQNNSVCINSAMSCETCCENADYSSGLVIDGFCSCSAKVDPIACARADPGHDACVICCLNRGYLRLTPTDDPADCVCQQ